MASSSAPAGGLAQSMHALPRLLKSLLVSRSSLYPARRRVSYDDASRFSREYRRHFGQTPMRDVERLRELAMV